MKAATPPTLAHQPAARQRLLLAAALAAEAAWLLFLGWMAWRS